VAPETPSPVSFTPDPEPSAPLPVEQTPEPAADPSDLAPDVPSPVSFEPQPEPSTPDDTAQPVAPAASELAPDVPSAVSFDAAPQPDVPQPVVDVPSVPEPEPEPAPEPAAPTLAPDVPSAVSFAPEPEPTPSAPAATEISPDPITLEAAFPPLAPDVRVGAPSDSPSAEAAPATVAPQTAAPAASPRPMVVMPAQQDSGLVRRPEPQGLTHPSDEEAVLASAAPASPPASAAFPEDVLPEPVQHGAAPDDLPDVPPAVINASVAALTKAFTPQEGSNPPAAMQEETLRQPGPPETATPPLLTPPQVEERPNVAMPPEPAQPATSQPQPQAAPEFEPASPAPAVPAEPVAQAPVAELQQQPEPEPMPTQVAPAATAAPEVAEPQPAQPVTVPQEPALPAAPAPEEIAELEEVDATAGLLDEEKAQRSAEIVRELLDLMAAPSGNVQPQERALAADTLHRMLTKIPESSKLELAERIAIMDDPPAMIVSRLVLDKNLDVAGLLIEKGSVVSDQDLYTLVDSNDIEKCILIARRRLVSPGVANALVDKNEPRILLALVRNPEASLSPSILQRLTELARNQPDLQAPLVTRPDMTPQVAFDLFWSLPTELRRYVFSRFLTDSGMLERILRVTIAAEEGDLGEDVWSGQNFPPDEHTAEAASLIEQGKIDEATKLLAQLGRVSESNANRIIVDPSGEPLTIIFKALGISRAEFADTLERWRASPAAILRADRDIDELKTLFDVLSYNKARVVLTYWDWLARKSGTSPEEDGAVPA
ncbi:MAG: DUF2336 domain-containing protein, partial [Pseudomonadota bacterium]